MWSEALATVPWLPAEIIDAALHHHEHLDGTGYPHRLKGSEISDSIFAALIERRSNRPPLASEAAYQVLLNMGRKLDRDLVREFRGICHMKVVAQ
jgi:HD-GYP domain-containing protein (c-di-GMP phosphodiesterase class II)